MAQIFIPTHQVPDGGVDCFSAPGSRRPSSHLDGPAPVEITESRGHWSHVRCRNGSETWVHGELLTPWRDAPARARGRAAAPAPAAAQAAPPAQAQEPLGQALAALDQLPGWVDEWASDRTALAVAVFLASAATTAAAAVISALTFSARGGFGGWKTRVNIMAGPGLIVAALMVLAMVLLSWRPDARKVGPIADLPRMAALAVLGMAAGGLLVMALDVVAAVTNMFSSFGSSIARIVGDAGVVALIGAAVAMARPHVRGNAARPAA